jgi:ABC-2 type transport system ATP-binding protein
MKHDVGTLDAAPPEPMVASSSSRAAASVPIEVRGLVKSYGRVSILRDLDFVVGAGELIGIEGENGAGKSTLLRCLVGLVSPDRGEVVVRGSLGYCPQEPTLVGVLTPAEVFRLFGAGYRMSGAAVTRRGAELMDRYGCRRFADVRVDNLSGGTRQKVNLIAAMLHDPDVLILDEPYQGFDYETYLTFWGHVEEFRQGGGSVVVVSHMHTEKHRFDRLVQVHDGALRPASTGSQGGPR